MNKDGKNGFQFLYDENIKKKYDRANLPNPGFTADEASWYVPFFD
jgi:hypothetical protein